MLNFLIKLVEPVTTDSIQPRSPFQRFGFLLFHRITEIQYFFFDKIRYYGNLIRSELNYKKQYHIFLFNSIIQK